MRSLSLSHRLFLLIAAALLPVSGVLFWNLQVLRTTEEREVQEAAFTMGQLAALEFQRTLSGFENLLFSVTAAPSVSERDPDKCSVYLARLAAKVPGIASLGVVNPDGTLRCRQDARGSGTDFSDRSYFQEASRSKELVVGEYTKGRITGQAVLPLALSSWDEKGKLEAVAVLAIDLAWLQAQVEQREFPEGSALTVGDDNGTILARHPFPERFVGKRIPEQYISLVNAPKPGTLELTSQDGTRRLLAYFPVAAPPKGLYVSAGLSTDVQYSALRTATVTGLLAAVAALALSLILYWHTSRRAIRAPMNRILDTISAWRAEEVGVRSGMSQQEGEFGAVGSAIDELLDELDESGEQQMMLARELDHRVKNMLAIVRMVARQTFKKGTMPEDLGKAFDDRLAAIAGSYDLLRNDGWQTAPIAEIVEIATKPFVAAPERRITVDGPELMVGSRSAFMLGMALHELATNAAKYGALSNPGGRITIRWRLHGDPAQFTFEWIERGGPPVVPPAATGFGSSLLKRALAGQLGAEVAMDFAPGGLICRIAAPASVLDQAVEADEKRPPVS